MPIEDHEALDAALDAYIAEVHEVASVIGLKAPDVDFGDEIAKIHAAKAEVDSKLAELRGDVPAVETDDEAGDAAESTAADVHAPGFAEGGVDLGGGDASWQGGAATSSSVGEPAADAGDGENVPADGELAGDAAGSSSEDSSTA